MPLPIGLQGRKLNIAKVKIFSRSSMPIFILFSSSFDWKYLYPWQDLNLQKNQVWAGYGFQLRHRGIIGMAGFEPATFGSQSRRATKLRHIPLMLLMGVEPTQWTDFKSAAYCQLGYRSEFFYAMLLMRFELIHNTNFELVASTNWATGALINCFIKAKK